MKNTIWVGMNKHCGVYIFTESAPTIKNGELCGLWENGEWMLKFLNIELKPLEIVEIIIDTETGKVEVKRPREIGWYLTVVEAGTMAECRHWDGNNFCSCRARDGYPVYPDQKIKVISEKLPPNEYLKSLE